MRISDWSSDVCSSDLEVIFGMRGIEIGRALEIDMIGQRNRGELGGPVCRIRLQQILDPLVKSRQLQHADVLVIIFDAQVEIMRRRGLEVGVAGVDRQHRLQPVGPRNRDVDEADPRLRRQLADLRPRDRQEIAAAEDQIVALTRSEEQTSELQSIMRISYADFCLKNKKQILITPK